MIREAGRSFRRLGKALAVLAAVAIAVAIAGKWWIAPGLIRWQLRAHLPEYWDGSAEIEDVDVDYTGVLPVAFRGVVLRDRAGRTWLRADGIRLVVPNWPSLSPKVGAVLATGVKVTAHAQAGRCRPPLRRLPSEWWTEYVDLKALWVGGGELEVMADGNSAFRSGAADILLLAGRESWALHVPTRPLAVRDLRAEAVLVRDDGVEIRRLSGRACGGRLLASVAGCLRPGGAVELRGHAAAKNLDLARLKLPFRWAERGLASGVFLFQAGEAPASAASGWGTVFIDGADLRRVPAAAEILQRAGLGKLDVLRDSDVEAQFRLRGAVATFDRWRFSLPLAAVDIEPGGWLHLWDEQVDVVAVVVLFERVRDLLKSIPVVGLVVDLTERFSRFRVRGNWGKVEDLLVTSAPLDGVANGTRKFLTAAARGGSGFRAALRGGLEGLFNSADANSPTARENGP